jgi:type II restriction/modification system DNA methylase subunit YeeA
LTDFVQRLSHVRILDPACGSGNFLYVAINLLLDLEKEVIAYGAAHGLTQLPQVRPTQLAGIEINPYAQELAQVVIWIGYLQWMHHNGFNPPRNPVLDPIDSIRCMDAILDLSDPEHPTEPEWPEADFIVGNPPFLGNKRMRSELGEEYSDAVWRLYEDRLPATSDLCCYWFEKARRMIERQRCARAGLLATTGIKQIGGRKVLERVNDSTQIFFAISDREWVLEGAAVRISIIGFGDTFTDETSTLDGQRVLHINADLTSGTDLTRKRTLRENANQCFMGTTKVGAFDIDGDTAIRLLSDTNPHGQPNSDVLRPFRNGSDLVQECSDRWIIDFGVGTSIQDASLYAGPFEYLVRNVKPEREMNKRKSRAERWWLLGETLPAFRTALKNHRRYIGTPRVSKHRVFVWLSDVVLPDSKVIAVVRDDDWSFGVLQSRVHGVWTLATSSLHGGERPTYNPTLSFETFPFPEPTDKQREAIADAARELDRLRTNWLNPPEWMREEVLEFPGSADGPWKRFVHNPNAQGIGTVRYPRLVPRDEACAKQLAKRTLTNLYNERPTWLDLAHRRLDETVFAAYGWNPSMTDDELLANLLALNLERATQETASR